VRDYLLEPDDARARARSGTGASPCRIDDTLRVYEQKLPDTEKDGFEDLRSHIESYWKSLAPALQWDTHARRAKVDAFCKTLSCRPREVFQLTRQVTSE